MRSIPGEDGSSSSIRYTNVFSHVELDLAMDWLPTAVIFEIQAHAVTRIMRILNFFAPNFGSHCRSSLEFDIHRANHGVQFVSVGAPATSVSRHQELLQISHQQANAPPVVRQTPRCSCGSALDPRFWVG